MPAMSSDSARAPMVSITSILILSAFLVVIPVCELLADEVSVMTLACGLIGLLGYVGLQSAAERRRLRAEKALKDRAAKRLDKHLTTPMVPPIALDFNVDPLAEHFRKRELATR
ncbi:MAG TPA: hypothetical protein VM510_10315 [Caulifigura sp.]|nr:hypothetical protein [Caulifigura sp.]